MELLKSEIKREDERRALELAQREKERLEKERKLKKEKERQEKERREKERIEAEKRRNEEKERQRLVTPNSDEITIHKVVKKKKHVTSEPDVIPIPKIIDESVTNQLIPLQQTEPVSEVVSSIPEPVPDLPKFVSDNKVCEKSVVVPDNQLDMENRDMMQDLINRLAEMPCEQRNEALKKILKNMCN
jgi:DNA primase catalytic subunit